MKSVVSEKGQVTIPKDLRDRLGLRAGTTLHFTEVNGVLHAQKILTEDVFRKWRGRGQLPFAPDVDAYLKIARDGE